MKRRNLLLFASASALFLLTSFAAFYPGGAPAGVTGSPGDGSNCASCHGTAATTTAGWITSNIPAGGYTPGQSYQITATNNMTGSGKYGFEISPQNSSGTLLGTLTAGTGNKLVGSGKYVTHSSASTTLKTWTFSWTAPAAGTGNVTFYGAFARNYSGLTTLSTLVVSEQAASLPAAAGPISGSATVCSNNSTTYSVGTISGATSYVWSVPTGASITAGQGTTTVTVNYSVSAVSGNVSVYGTNGVGNGTPSNLAITVNSAPIQPGVIAGSANPCQGSSQSYTVTNVAGVTYNWTVPAGSAITAGQGTNSITATVGSTNGNIGVTPSNSCGNGTERTFALAINLVPAQAGTITGSTSPCQGSSQTYSVTNLAGVTYTWIVPAGWAINAGQGTNTITATTGASGGNVNVTPGNSCGNGPERVLAIAISTAPAQPSLISGSETPCQGSSQTYSVTNIAGVTYTWAVQAGSTITAGQGTNAITVTVGTAGGNINVVPSNACGSGAEQIKAVTVGLFPGVAGAVSGPDMVDLSSVTSSDYTTTPATDADSYQWELSPVNAGTISGTSTTATVTWNGGYLGAANVRVKAVNTCGEGGWSIVKPTEVINTTGVTVLSAKPGMKVYPSPSYGTFTVELNGMNEKSELRLLDLAGKVLYKAIVSGQEATKLDIPLAPGIYLVQVQEGSNILTQKLIIR